MNKEEKAHIEELYNSLCILIKRHKGSEDDHTQGVLLAYTAVKNELERRFGCKE